MVNEKIDLRFATNMLGRLDKSLERRINRYVKHPTFEGWDDIHGIILNGTGTMLTVWNAVIAIDPTFPKVGRTTTIEGRIIKDWERIPTAEQIKDAVFYATH